VFGLAVPTPARAETLTLASALARSLDRNAEVRAARVEVDAAQSRVDIAGRLSRVNPELSLQAGPRWNQTQTSADLGAALSLPVEISGQAQSRSALAHAELKSAQARFAKSQGRVAAEVQQAFGGVLAAQGRAALTDQALQLAQEALVAAQERHRAGDASLIEVNLARIELGRATRERSEALAKTRAASARLKQLLAEPPETALECEGTLETLPRSALASSELLANALAHRPELADARAELEAAAAAQEAASRDAFPTPRLGAAYAREDGADLVRGTLSFELPVFNQNDPARAEALNRARKARASLEAVELEVRRDVQRAVDRRQAAREAADSYSGEVVQAAESNLALANDGYRAGQLDFVQLMLIRREALETRRGQLAALEELNAAEADLARVEGPRP
jgi:cobalt-zinc-cadmium efflux system outer membrane protein